MEFRSWRGYESKSWAECLLVEEVMFVTWPPTLRNAASRRDFRQGIFAAIIPMYSSEYLSPKL